MTTDLRGVADRRVRATLGVLMLLGSMASARAPADEAPSDATATVKHDAKVLAKAAKEGAQHVAAAAKEVAHDVVVASKKVAVATQEGAQQVAAAAKQGAEKAKAAVRPVKTDAKPEK